MNLTESLFNNLDLPSDLGSLPVIASADSQRVMAMLGIGEDELVLNECHIVVEDDGIAAVGIMCADSARCRGHYEGNEIFPLHWTLLSQSELGSLLIKYEMRHESNLLPQVVSVQDAKGSAIIRPGDRIVHMARIERGKARMRRLAIESFLDGGSEPIASSKMLFVDELPDFDIPSNPWED